MLKRVNIAGLRLLSLEGLLARLALGWCLGNWLFKHFENKTLYSTFIYSFSNALHFFMLIQLPILFIIFLPEEFSFNINVYARSAVSKFCFCLYEKVFFFLTFKGYFHGIWNSELTVFSLSQHTPPLLPCLHGFC